ncbi:hypothetical protein BU24DRAFT_161708 [Aaosphaeria arxii CBS 175.79]|uniref:Tat pathway signal sequence n=1 Tax=Aaosphaeria arxii CBS 175.79 TaxID=1450172 RepID=A0A6A5XYU5_9PLEO|nr:uncharacterized protein BU24DRAFT_161708 [Aaosphaeria arxii CBS 175.79]KAF2017881.1 hypothetical protein BU24DRAFT_161708 [Aaosphaeria arxii CBS 175.79]
MDFWKSKADNAPAAKRISTPAGQRLSVILENGDAANRTRDRASVRKSGMLATFGDAPRESIEEQSGSGYSTSVWSDGEKLSRLKNNKQIAKRGGWKRLLVIVAVVLACIIALAVGLAIGLKKKKSSNDDSQQPAAAGASSTASPVSPSSLPPNFPQGTYSMVTFLDTVQTNCTSNPATWTCYPYTDYNTSPSKSLATFNWIISSPSSGKYQISSTDNPFSISFKNTDLELLDQGKDTERYRFQLSSTKTVSPSTGLTKDNEAASCEFQGTSLQAVLYTKMAKGYPDASKGESDGSPSYPVWPFAVRVEQSVGGGESIPSCKASGSGNSITEGLEPQDAGSLCSCLYKNWRTPSPY